MNLSALPELLLAWFKNQGAPQAGADKQGGTQMTFRPGAQYEGKVLDHLPGGRHLVHVAGQKMDMALPRDTQPGDNVRLTYLSGGQRPTFLLNQTAPAPASATPSQPVSLSSTAQQVNALMRLAAPHTTTAAAPTPANPPSAATASPRTEGANSVAAASPRLANASNLPALAQAARTAGQLVVDTQATEVARASSSPSAVTTTRPIAANVVMLQNYSAVQSPIPGGVVSPNTALVGQAVEGLRASVPSSTNLTPNVLAELPEPSRNLLPTRLHQTLSESGLFYESHLARWTKGELSFETLLREPQARLGREAVPNATVAELGGMPDEAARLAGKQLHLLEGAPFVWQGLAWPGQWMEWLVEERRGGDGEADGQEDADQWRTELRLELPRLGSVHARIGLNGDRLNLSITTPEESVRDEMRRALPQLIKGLEAAGLRPGGMSVESGHAG